MREKVLLLFVLLMLTLSGCTTNAELEPPQPEIQTPKESPADQEVINLHGQVTGLYYLDEFLNKERISQKIVSYTIEGDPIYHTLTHMEDDTIEVLYDPTQDAYGSNEISTFSCNALLKSDTDNALVYSLSQCDNGNLSEPLILLDYQLGHLESLDFRLEYGVDQGNAIDTETKQITAILENGESFTANDVHLNVKTRTQIYKEMVKHGAFTTSSEGNTTCSKTPYESYSLIVKFRNETYRHEWNECDKAHQELTQLTDIMTDLINAYYKSNVTLGKASPHTPSELQRTEQLLLGTDEKEYLRGETVTYHMANQSDQFNLTYGEDVFIEQNTNSGWREAHVNVSFHEPAYGLNPGETAEMEAYQARKLPPGEYRLIKKVTHYNPKNREARKDLVLISNSFHIMPL
ncbi:immunoglobulin-like domain-containing protein [Paenibacillus provencensis]|uniref:Immunoglobulin-like domain-containing protein n=1 Tax=Paenibacillus provencensis TaxID=441151 RepID=A0ABW3Q5I2_9BACL|nr:immunoglobulin-like domain-containing protein [Paenibacillus sp. MER 78]MCM3129203.1 DUF4362 domain-containing protein [Paenibacillus sp. MER 78]